MFNMFLDEPPKYNANTVIALPFTLLLEWPAVTRAGLAAFLDKELNVRLGAMLNKWGSYLKDPGGDSNRYIVNELSNSDSWLSAAARFAMKERDPCRLDFEKLYMCDPDHPNLGYATWDAFFTRKFRDPSVTRRVENTSDNTITNGCESAPYAIKQRVKYNDEFWIKGQPYSLKHMLDSVEDAKRYSKGTVYQAYLSAITYHRWHSPINGKVNKLRLIPGGYFSYNSVNAFPDASDLAPMTSQSYMTSTATRALIYLENSTVGEMVMIPVGMGEVSTCEFNEQLLSHFTEVIDPAKADPSKNHSKADPSKDHTKPRTWLPSDGKDVMVKKGDELGMFHFGGSTHCLVFGPQVHLKFWQRAIPIDSEEDYFIPINAVLADVKKSSDDLE